ncbi:hypothetical protein SAMN06269185_2330 [Natronoarchaeum philippinense]|uniref:Uncharacterized protein n=1 Tax=Natronoarchaeum philippinense TaxID=558529 RepID=A0A285P514_NATPI|nr:hypothetical protein [Natronoarchaeum philippinense]SNZ14961.1 hypothetical protein SAMN06269185_2330 [Natronoarchaeum philippinense]
MDRRELLGVGIGLVTAGCLSPEADAEAEDPVTIGAMRLRNGHGESHEIAVDLQADGETVFTTTRTLDGADDEGATGVDIARDWPAEVDQYTVEAAIDGGGPETVVFDEPHPETCHLVTVAVTPDEFLEILYSGNGAETC